MAQKAKKDRAKSNAATLTNLHLGSLIVNALFLLSHFLLSSRSLWLFGLLSAPSLICEYILEISGRPKYDPATKALRSSGEDLSAQGLTEYMFDVIWVTWASTIFVILLGNKAWFLWLVVPAYGFYLGSGLLGMGRQKMAELQGAGAGDAVPQGNRKARRAA
ncbi:Fc.00g076930.m01.CDS01 [Cosmosporella sp. VM-42]